MALPTVHPTMLEFSAQNDAITGIYVVERVVVPAAVGNATAVKLTDTAGATFFERTTAATAVDIDQCMDGKTVDGIIMTSAISAGEVQVHVRQAG